MRKNIPLLLGVLVLSACTPKTVPATDIVYNNEVIYLNKEATFEVKPTVLPSDASNKKINYVIEDTTVATITDLGILKGVNFGETVLTMTLAENDKVSNKVIVKVIDKNWPTHDIFDFAGFELPSFVDFTFVDVKEEEDELVLSIQGSVTPGESLLRYKDQLLGLGWEVEGSFDDHIGTLTHHDYEFELTFHNNYVHEGNDIELHIGKHAPHIHGEGIPNEELEEHFGFTLPDFTHFHDSSYVKENDGSITVIFSGVHDSDEIFVYAALLEKEGWVSGEANNDHSGDFTNFSKKGYVSYHSSISHGTDQIEFNT